MSDNSKFDSTVSSLFKGMDGFLSAKTVVGEPVTVNDTIILPLVDVSFGVAAGAGSHDNKNTAAGGLGGKMSPSAVLVIHDGVTRLVNIKNQDSVSKLIDLIPEAVDKISKWKDKKDPDVEKAVENASK
ncbi:MAG: GerW family sporulation protein [Butyrivibrio sp.]